MGRAPLLVKEVLAIFYEISLDLGVTIVLLQQNGHHSALRRKPRLLVEATQDRSTVAPRVAWREDVRNFTSAAPAASARV
jgi:ABC-type branched-subunit amino acid transport system ATPase component